MRLKGLARREDKIFDTWHSMATGEEKGCNPSVSQFKLVKVWPTAVSFLSVGESRCAHHLAISLLLLYIAEQFHPKVETWLLLP